MAAATSRAVLLFVVVVAGAFAPRPVPADDTPGAPAWLGETTVNGFFEGSYGYDFNRPLSGTNYLHVFDFDDNTFKADVFELVLQHAAAKPRESGFRVDLAAGGSIPRVSAAAGLFRDAFGEAQDFDLQQAYVSWVAPIGSGLKLDFGKFVTPAGYEVIEGYDGWNDNASRSLLFGFAIPFTHVGARASATFSSRASAMLMVVNGWDVARDNNTSKTVGLQLTLTPVAPLTVYLTGMSGPEEAGDDSDLRNLLDAVAVWKPSSRLTLAANGDWATENNAAPGGTDAKWSGVAGYVRVGLGKSTAVTVRGEYFADPDGVRTGVAQFLNEFTITPEIRLSRNLLVRVDGRIDRSNLEVFDKQGTSIEKTQPTVLFSAVYAF